MRIAVLGGSFNPIQIAHLALADEVLKTFSYDKIIFVPAGIPPHKEIMDTIPPEKRFRMVQLAVEDNESFDLECFIDIIVDKLNTEISIELKVLLLKIMKSGIPGFLILSIQLSIWKENILMFLRER